MSKICICGHFGGKNVCLDGQTVKTKNLYNTLKTMGADISVIDTYNPKKRLISIIFQCIKATLTNKNIIILPAHNGIKLFVPLFSVFSSIFKNKIHYAVVGGWLPEYLTANKWLIKFVKKLDFIYVEANMMKENLNKLGLNNVSIMCNFKDLQPVETKEINADHEKPYKFCTFSRVSKEKGIEDAVNAIISLNDEYKDVVATLDIYGPVDEDYKERFEKIKKDFPEYIRYMGMVPSEKSVEIIKEYYMLLFPTYYEGEGFAGTLIDAFSAALPVIATNWRYNSEIVTDGHTGYIYSYKEKEKLKEKIKFACENPDSIQRMRYNCVEESKKYIPEIAIFPLYKNLEE